LRVILNNEAQAFIMIEHYWLYW